MKRGGYSGQATERLALAVMMVRGLRERGRDDAAVLKAMRDSGATEDFRYGATVVRHCGVAGQASSGAAALVSSWLGAAERKLARGARS